MKVKLIQDLIIEVDFLETKYDKKIYDKGHIFEPNESGEYEYINEHGVKVYIKEEDFLNLARNNKSFEILDDNKHKISINEIDEQEENKISNWRLELDIKTTKKNLKEIEKSIKEILVNY